MRRFILLVAIFTLAAMTSASAQSYVMKPSQRSAQNQTQNQARKTRKPFTERAVSPGVRVGMNIHRLSFSDDFEYDMKQTVGFHAGAVLDVKVYKNFYFQHGVLFSSRGGSYKERYYYVYDSGNRANVDHTFETKVEAYYIELHPLTFQYRFPISLGSRISIEAGPYLAFGLSGETQLKEKFSYNSERHSMDVIVPTFYSEKKKTEECYGLKRFDAGLHFGAGFHIAHFYFGLNYSLGLTNLYEKKARTGRALQDKVQIRNSSLSITAGYNF